MVVPSPMLSNWRPDMTTALAPETSPATTNKPTKTHPGKNDRMTTALAPTPTAAPSTVSRAADTGSGKVRTSNVIKGEWIKFWSVRSLWVTLISAGLALVAFGMIFSSVAESGAAAPGPAAFLSNPVDIALGGVGLAEMVIGVLGVLVVAGEYSTGLIRTAFAAVGRRSRVIRAKVAVVAGSVFAVSGVATTAAIAAGQAVYAGSEPTVPLTEVTDVILGTSVYLTGIALIGIAFGFILRSTAGAIGTLVGGVFIGPNLLNLLPADITDYFMKYLPSEAGAAIMTQVDNPDLLSQGAAYGVFIAWVFGLLAVAAVLVNRRDA